MRPSRRMLVSGLFDHTKYSSGLRTVTFGRTIEEYAQVESTQTVLLGRRNAGLEEGKTCVADVQTSGRGRGSAKWESPLGCLLFSFCCTIRNPSRLATLQHLVSLAVAQTGNEVASCRIKWPNDVYSSEHYEEEQLRRKKIAGILLQSTSTESSSFLVSVGIGMNVENKEPTTCLKALAKVDPATVTRENILAKFFNVFEPMYYEFLEHGFSRFIDEYQNLWIHSGQRLRLAEQGNTWVTVGGLSPDTGHLLAYQDDGRLVELQPDVSSVDLLDSLVRVKT